MTEEILFQRGTTYVRRLRLAPGEAIPWRRDPDHRAGVISRGDALAIEYRHGEQRERFTVKPGQVGWEEPLERIHRGVNVRAQPCEDATGFSLDRPDAVPQPKEVQ